MGRLRVFIFRIDGYELGQVEGFGFCVDGDELDRLRGLVLRVDNFILRIFRFEKGWL